MNLIISSCLTQFVFLSVQYLDNVLLKVKYSLLISLRFLRSKSPPNMATGNNAYCGNKSTRQAEAIKSITEQLTRSPE